MSGKAIRNAKPIKDTKRSTRLSIVIPSAGEGNRMRSVGPRSLVMVGNKTLIQYQTDILQETFPLSDIVLVSGFESNRLMNKAPKGIICTENERYLETSVLRSIAIGLRASINDNVLIVYGDLVFNRELLDFPVTKSCIIYEQNQSIVDDTDVGCTLNDDKLENLFYGLPNRWNQILFLTGKELSMMKEIAFDKQKEKLFTWEAINSIIENGGEFYAYCPRGAKCMDIDSTKDIEKIGKFIS